MRHKPEYDIGTAFSDTFSLIKQRPLWLLVWGALLVVLPMLPAIPLYSWMVSNADIWMNDPEAINQAGGVSMLANLSSLLQMVLLIPVVAAVIRFVLGKPTASGFAGLRLGMDELWVFVTCIALYIGMVIVMMLALTIGVLAGVLIAISAGKAVGVLIGIVIGFLLLLPALWLSIRLSLLMPASVDLNTFALVEAWNSSRGRFWPLLGTWFLMVLATFGLSILWFIVIGLIGVIVLIIGVVTGMGSFATEPATWNWIPMVVIGGLLAIVPTMWLSAATYVLYSGPFASAWRQLKPAAVVVAEPAVTPEF